MTKTYMLLTALLIVAAAHSQPFKKQNFINVHAGYGTETNIGNPGYFVGAGLGKTYGNKFSSEVSFSYFHDSGEQEYSNAQDKYRAVFGVAKIGFLITGNNQSFFQTKFSVGPALKWYHYKGVANIYLRLNPDGSTSVVEPVLYYNEQMLVFSLYGGIDFSFRLSDKVNAALFLDTYSREILLEHFMPGVKIGFKL